MSCVASYHVRLLLAAAVLAAVAAGLPAPRAVAYTPDHPDVREAVARGVRFLESPAGNDTRMGGKALVGLAVLKSGAGRSHPRVVEAVAAAKSQITANMDASVFGDHRTYQLAMTGIFLAELDAEQYAKEIEIILRFLDYSQKPFGGWGYHAAHQHAKTSDTSMTQYVVLLGWEATQAGFEVPRSMIDRGLVWLMKTQDPSGGWGYQGIVSPSFTPVPQDKQTPSLTVAGLGSVYASADLLGLTKIAGTLPAALEKVDESGSSRPRSSVSSKQVEEVQARGNQWMQRNYTVELDQWTYYYLYGLERYMSFREAAEGREEKEPKWYNEGVSFLLSHQSESGSWPKDYPLAAGEPVSTSFGVLFLVRSMKKSIERARNFGSGTLVGGRGLPKDTDAVVVRDGSVISLPEAEAVEQVLEAVGKDSDAEQYQQIAALAAMPLEDATPLIDKHAEKLRRLAADASPEARRAAVSALAKRRSMDDVPVLIYALGDPDPSVVLEARDGLRRISRKFHGFGLPDQFTDAERRTAIAQWKQWYLEVRPDAEFMQ
jgi:hypothetical protein